MASVDVVTINKKDFLAMVGDLPFSEKQLNLLMQTTPAKFIKSRPIPGGGEAEFVEISYIIGMLNIITGYQWDFEIVEEKEAHGQIIVRGKLTIQVQNGKSPISKTQYGRASIKYPKHHKPGDEPLDYGNDHKAAASDALKKCASLFGIAWDVFGKDDMREVQIIDEDTESRNAKIAEREKNQKPIDEVQRDVNAQLDVLESTERIRFMKKTVGKITAKNFTEADWRRLDDAFSPKEEEGTPATEDK
jgi:hypothetical protein